MIERWMELGGGYQVRLAMDDDEQRISVYVSGHGLGLYVPTPSGDGMWRAEDLPQAMNAARQAVKKYENAQQAFVKACDALSVSVEDFLT